MSLKKILAVLLPLGVLALTIEILWRRMVVGQIPTQFSTFLVYSLIGVNLFYLGFEVTKFFKQQKTVR